MPQPHLVPIDLDESAIHKLGQEPIDQARHQGSERQTGRHIAMPHQLVGDFKPGDDEQQPEERSCTKPTPRDAQDSWLSTRRFTGLGLGGSRGIMATSHPSRRRHTLIPLGRTALRRGIAAIVAYTDGVARSRAHPLRRLATCLMVITLLSLLVPKGATAQNSPPEAEVTFLVASDTQGLLRLGAEGAVLEVLTATPARVARRVGDRILFLGASSNDLREYNLTTRLERVVARLPGNTGLGCGGEFGAPGFEVPPYLIVDYLQDEESMAADATRVCFRVMDRNANMVSVHYLLDVPLDGGAVTTLMLSAEHCQSVDYEESRALPCPRLLVPQRLPRAGRPRRAPWSLETRRGVSALRGPRNARRTLALSEASLEHTSPDGRWALLSGNPTEGDYIHRSLYLVDLTRGELHGIAEGVGSHPLAGSVLADADALAALGYSATGETSILWLDARTLLLGGRLVVRPGVRVFTLPGARIP